MARVLVVESHPEVRDLLARITRRLGHDAVFPGPGDDGVHVDAVLLEPAAEGALETATPALRSGAALVCVSILPASRETLALTPVAYLQKPFSLVELERAILSALEPAPSARAV